MPRTTGVFVKRAAKRKRSNRRVVKRRVKRRLTNAKLKDIVSRKKRDTMTAYSSFGSPTAPFALPPVRGTSFSPRTAAEQPHFNLWCASYRPLAAAAYDSGRNMQSVYVKGLSDRYRIEIENAPWEWRRIVFMSQTRYTGTASTTRTFLTDPSIGSRTVANMRVVGQGTTNGQPSISVVQNPSVGVDLFDVIFKGQRGIDWVNYFTAKTDTSLIKVLSDKKFRLGSGNESGAAKVKKFYTPVNKTLVYDDDEAGVDQNGSGFTAAGAKNGNIYVLDMFWNEAGNDPTAAGMTWSADATYYWHEH